MYTGEQDIEPTDVPESFQVIQQSLNDFVAINYGTALGLISQPQLTEAEILHYKSKVLDIIRNNPPLTSLPKYLRDEREDYLWYSDFYDEISKDVYHQYRTFVKPIDEITPINYVEELAKINLPYFKDLVNLVALERLCINIEKRLPAPKKDVSEEIFPAPPVAPKTPRPKRLDKRSYEPTLNKKQYSLVVEYLEKLKLFRRPVKVTLLKKLFAGKLPEPLQVANQKSLVYLFDQFMEQNYIIDTWIAVAVGNKDFISFRTEGNKQRYGEEVHYISMEQMMNCRNRNKKEGVKGLIAIDELIELLNKIEAE